MPLQQETLVKLAFGLKTFKEVLTCPACECADEAENKCPQCSQSFWNKDVNSDKFLGNIVEHFQQLRAAVGRHAVLSGVEEAEVAGCPLDMAQSVSSVVEFYEKNNVGNGTATGNLSVINEDIDLDLLSVAEDSSSHDNATYDPQSNDEKHSISPPSRKRNRQEMEATAGNKTSTYSKEHETLETTVEASAGSISEHEPQRKRMRKATRHSEEAQQDCPGEELQCKINKGGDFTLSLGCMDDGNSNGNSGDGEDSEGKEAGEEENVEGEDIDDDDDGDGDSGEGENGEADVSGDFDVSGITTISFGGVTKEIVRECTALCAQMTPAVEFTKKWHQDETGLFVTMRDPSTNVPAQRTYKLIASIAADVPIVCSRYIEDCHDAGRLLDVNGYLLKYHRMRNKLVGSTMFSKFKVHFEGLTLKLKHMKVLMGMTGAQLLDSPNVAASDLHDTRRSQRNLRLCVVGLHCTRREALELAAVWNARVVSENWVLDSIYRKTDNSAAESARELSRIDAHLAVDEYDMTVHGCEEYSDGEDVSGSD